MKRKLMWNFCFAAVAVVLAAAGMLPAADAEAKDTLVYVMGAEPTSLDPPNLTDAMSGTAMMMLYGGGTFGEAQPPCYEYDPEKAKRLLKEAGYQGEELRLWALQGRYTMDRETAETIQGFWQQVGINVKFRVREWASYLRGLRLTDDKVKYQTALIGIGDSTTAGDMGIREYYHSDNIPNFNRARYSNPEYDKLAEAQSVELDEEKRREIMKKAQEIIMQDLPWIALHNLDQVIGIRKNLKGVEILPFDGTLVRKAYFVE